MASQVVGRLEGADDMRAQPRVILHDQDAGARRCGRGPESWKAYDAPRPRAGVSPFM